MIDPKMAVTEYLGQTKGTVSQTLKVLERKKYLSKHSDDNDKRITHLNVTNTGNSLLRDSIPTPKFIRACEQLPDDLQTEISLALNQLLLSFIESNEMKSFGVCSSCRYHQQKTGEHYFCNLVEEPLKKDEIELICREHKS
ncbi:MAG: MarR family transcriptional regulator [Cocleimonas sp.]